MKTYKFTYNLNKVINSFNIYRFSLASYSPTPEVGKFNAVVLSIYARGNIRSFKNFETGSNNYTIYFHH